MILGYWSPQVGMADRGGQRRELKSALISFSFITPEFSRENVGGQRRRVGFGRVGPTAFETNPTSTNKRISYLFKHRLNGGSRQVRKEKSGGSS